MEIAVIGASGRTGSAFTRAATAAGLSVRAVVRDPLRVTVPADRVEVADARSGSALAEAIRGVDAVAWCVGPGRDTPPDVMATSIAATIAAMNHACVARLVAITATGPFNEGDNPVTRYLLKPILWRFLGAGWRDMAVTEELIRPSSLDWTIVRPPRLTDRPARGRYQSRRGRNVRWGFSITRADLAQAMVDVLADPSTVHEIVSVAS
jgi:putative NADH-flavin reductase